MFVASKYCRTHHSGTDRQNTQTSSVPNLECPTVIAYSEIGPATQSIHKILAAIFLYLLWQHHSSLDERIETPPIIIFSIGNLQGLDN